MIGVVLFMFVGPFALDSFIPSLVYSFELVGGGQFNFVDQLLAYLELSYFRLPKSRLTFPEGKY